MARCAGLRETTGDVIRVDGALEILQVARDAGRAGQVVVVVGMAIAALARRHGVRSGECEINHRVIKGRRSPRQGCVALRAIGGEVRRNVIRIRRALKIFQVAANAGRAGQAVVVVDVTVDTLPRRYGVPTREGEAHRAVVEVRIEPGVRAVANGAGCGESAGHVIRIAG